MALIFPTEAEQITQIDHEAESEMPSAFSLLQEDIDHVLRLGGRTEQTRMEVAALFMTGKSPIEIANFLSREYRGGLGLLTDNGRMSAWFGEQGIWLARGDHALDAAPGMYIPWLNAAERIGELMDAGQFATNVELAESQGYYRTQLAQSLWYLRQDFSEMANEMSLMSSLDNYRGGGFPQDTARLANALADPETLATIMQDMEAFAQIYEQGRGVLRFHHLHVPAMLNGLHDLAAPWKEYTSDMAAVPGAGQFITEDELDEALSYGSMVSGGKERIYTFFSEPHTTREQAAFLREEYGIGGHSGPFSNKRHSSEQHDSKGIKLEKNGCATVTLTWNAVAKRVATLIKADRYLTEEEKGQLQREQEPAEPVPDMPVTEPLIADDVPPAAEAEPEEDDFSDIDPKRVREHLAEHGIVNGEVVDPDRLAQSPFIQQVEADVERIATEEAAEEEAAVIPEDTPEDRFHVIEVDWYPGRVAYSIWDDQTDSYYEDKDGLTVDFVSRWQAEEYRNDLVESAQREATLSPLDRAKELIDEYCLEEFSEGANFTDLTTIGVAFTTITDDEIPIQAYVDLVGFKLERYLGETLIDVRQYDSLEALIAGELEELSFDDLTYASDEQIAAVLAQEAEQADDPLAEQAEQFEAEQQDYRNQVLSGLPPDQQRIVAAMETAGYLFRPTETNPIYFGDLDDYPITFDSWDAVYEFINSAELRDTPGLREQVQAVLHPEAAFPYAVGDTVYLEDGKPFVIDSIGTSDVHLLDPSLRFPVFRAESRENFLRLMERYPQEQNTEPTPTEQPTATEETVDFYSGEVNGLPFDVEIRTLNFGEPEQEPAPAQETAAEPVADPELTPDEAIDRSPISVQIGGEWRTFPSREAAEEALYADYKEQTHRNAQNFHITDDALGEGGPKAKYQTNVSAIRLLQHLEAEGLQASPEQQEVLSRYVGWGSLADAFDPNKPAWAQEYQELKSLLSEEEYAAARASTLNAHYTSPTVIKAIYEAVGNMGFQTGNILEPSMGVGNFFGLLPDSMAGSKLYGVELDSITGRMARQLYPHADIKVAGFETTDRRDFYDLAVGNVPFGDYKVNDRPYNKLGFSIHNYFFAKALDQVRPGGVVAFVTSRYTMDAKSPEVRKYLAQRAELLGAIRLPNNAFRANAGTDVVSDIIFLQKRDTPIDIDPDWVHLGQTPEGFAINSYFVDHPEMVLGELTSQSTQYGREECTVAPIPGADLAEQLHEAVSHIQGSYQ
ncbi:MAG: class I SAM-dependent methyltransferase, partial [Clostridiales bacterium]|nr:class I SAM-dependent methyltransferase [Clostridiales bacterium]